MIVVSNTSAITNLAAIGQLDILRQLYGHVTIPRAVYDELTDPRNESGRAEVQSVDWIEVTPVTNKALAASLLLEIDAGEAEAIALAVESGADLLLIDERLGRRAAARFGLKFVGIMGVLVEAKHRGQLAVVKPLIDDLIVKAGFRVSDELYRAVLHTTREL